MILAACTGDVNFTLTTLLGSDFLPQILGLRSYIKRGGVAMYGHSLSGATATEMARMIGTFFGGPDWISRFLSWALGLTMVLVIRHGQRCGVSFVGGRDICSL